MGCDKTLTNYDRIVQHRDRECFGPFHGLKTEGPRGLPSLQIYQNDHLDIDLKRDELYIFRRGTRAPIGVTFEHSLRTGRYSGTNRDLDGSLLPRFSVNQVERAKKAILAGRVHSFHFISDVTLKAPLQPSFPTVIRHAIEKANAELIAHYLKGYREFPDAQITQVRDAILAVGIEGFLLSDGIALSGAEFEKFPENVRQSIERAKGNLIADGKHEHLISYHSINYRRQIPLNVWTPVPTRPPVKEVHYPGGHSPRARSGHGK